MMPWLPNAPIEKAYSQRDAVEMIMSMTMELDITAMKSFLESMISISGRQHRGIKNKGQRANM